MLKLKEYQFRIIGESPLLIHAPHQLLNGDDGPKGKYGTPEEQAEKAVYRDANGFLIFPSVAFRSAIIKAAGGIKGSGRKSLAHFMGHIRTASEYVTLLDPDAGDPIRGYAVDVRRAVVQRQGIARCRARLNKWSCQVGILAAADILDSKDKHDTADKLLSVLNEAGQTIGVGDFRLERKGWFGLFRAEAI